MWSVILETHPAHDSDASDTVGGAYATVFVDEPYAAAAEQAARSLVAEYGWVVGAMDSIQRVEREDFSLGSPGRESYDQATLDGICATFHKWPIDAPDAEQTAHGVAIVVDSAFGHELESISRWIHVWIADTPLNRSAAERVWRERRTHDLESGVTTFRVDAHTSAEERCVEILPTVVEHHGAFSHDPPLQFVEVIGCEPTDMVRATFADAGFPDVTITSRGWRATSRPAV